MQKGFYFTLEIMICLILSAFIFSSEIQMTHLNEKEIYAIQKQNDLLKVWALTQESNENKMRSDIEWAFPETKAILFINNKKIEIKGKEKNAAVSQISYYDLFANEIKVKLAVYN